jgi:hypothetical protein
VKGNLFCDGVNSNLSSEIPKYQFFDLFARSDEILDASVLRFE